MLKLNKIGVLVFVAVILFAGIGYSDDVTDRFVRLKQDELRAKEQKVNDILNHIKSIESQVSEEQKEARLAQEKIWQDYSASLEIERKNLKDQLNSIDDRSRLFESEFEKKKQQDNLRSMEKQEEMKRLMAQAERLKLELDQDRKYLDAKVAEVKARDSVVKVQTDTHADEPVGTSNEVLQNGTIRITPGDGSFADEAKLRGGDDSGEEYFLEIGDAVDIDVWRVPDLTRTVVVRPDGRISIPLVGDLDVAGMSLVDLRTVMTKKFSEYIINPQVSISIRQFGGRKFIVLGEVAGPGVYRYQQDISLIEALALAGGFNAKAKKGKVMIIRGDIRKEPQVKIITANMQNLLNKGMLTENISVKPNDIIYVGKDLLTDYNEIINNLIKPSFATAVDYYVVKSARREDRRAEAVFN